MKSENKVRGLPNKEHDVMQAGIEALTRIMPQQAALAMMMRKEFVEAGFTDDEALKLTAYSIFR